MSVTYPRRNPAFLPGLSPHDAVVDAVHRFIQGLDFNDDAILRSAFTDDAVFVLAGEERRGLDTIAQFVARGVGPMATAHHVSNVRVRMAADERSAFVTAYGLAQHFLPGEGVGADGVERRRYTMGNYYAMDMVRDEASDAVKGGSGEGEELWRMRRFELSTLWAEGDASVVPPGSLTRVNR